MGGGAGGGAGSAAGARAIASSMVGSSAAATGVPLELNPAALRFPAEEDPLATAVAASAQKTLELLLCVLPEGGGGVLGVDGLTAGSLCGRPVPFSLIFQIVSAVCANTGFADGAFTDAHGEAVLRAIDPAAAAGPAPPGSPHLSAAAARLQLFQKLGVRILQVSRGGGAADPADKSEAKVTARAIAIELQKQRAPLALNEFLQHLALAGAAHAKQRRTSTMGGGHDEVLLPAAALGPPRTPAPLPALSEKLRELPAPLPVKRTVSWHDASPAALPQAAAAASRSGAAAQPAPAPEPEPEVQPNASKPALAPTSSKKRGDFKKAGESARLLSSGSFSDKWKGAIDKSLTGVRVNNAMR